MAFLVSAPSERLFQYPETNASVLTSERLAAVPAVNVSKHLENVASQEERWHISRRKKLSSTR